MLRLMCSGSLTADAVQRTTQKGNAYVTFQLRAQAGSDAVLVSCACFDAAVVAEVLRLRRGDSVAISGRGELRHWVGRDDKPGYGLSCTVDKLITMRPPKREKTAKPAPNAWREPGNLADMPNDLEEVY